MIRKIEGSPSEHPDRISKKDSPVFSEIDPTKHFPSKEKKVTEKEEKKKQQLSPLDLSSEKNGKNKNMIHKSNKVAHKEPHSREISPSSDSEEFDALIREFFDKQDTLSRKDAERLIEELQNFSQKTPSLDSEALSYFSTIQAMMLSLQNQWKEGSKDNISLAKKTALSLLSAYENVLSQKPQSLSPKFWENIEDFFLFLSDNSIPLNSQEQDQLTSFLSLLENKASTLPRKMEKNFFVILQKLAKRQPLLVPREPIEHFLQMLSSKSKEKKIEKKEESLQGQSAALPSPYEALAPQKTDTILPSYLDPKMQTLFEQMVGMLTYARKTGVSETEVLLNSPTLKNSLFYQSKVVFVKYDTAPDSFNIRLIGNQNAIELFQNNLSQLEMAFKENYLSGNISFRIGRIMTERSEEKPLFERKETIQEEKEDHSNG